MYSHHSFLFPLCVWGGVKEKKQCTILRINTVIIFLYSYKKPTIILGAEGDLSLSCSFCQWHSSSVELSGTKAAILQAVKDRQAGESDKQLAELMKFEQQRAKEESQKKELAKQSKSQAFYRKGGRFSKFNFAKAPQMTNRGKTLENLRDRQNKRYNEARHEWVDETCAREYIAPTITAADMVSGAAKDAGLEAALAIKDFSQVSTLGQRYLDLGQQGAATAKLWPSFTNLVAKRSKRCRECQHNLIKPELNPTYVHRMAWFAPSICTLPCTL